MAPHLVSILVRSRNDGAFITATLKAILAQECEIPFEVLCCDDASTDDTAALIAAFPQVKILPRPDGEYRPGRRLNYMVGQCQGDIAVFNNADAIPQNVHWLSALIAPLLEGTADAVYGNQIPREDAKWLVRKDYARAFGDGKTAAKWGFFFSLATSAIWRKSLQDEPFDEEIRYSEDVEWAHRRPRRIAYAQEAVVEHSHNYTLAELKRRFYGEGYADAQIFGRRSSLARELLSGTLETLRDFGFLLRHPAGLAGLPVGPGRGHRSVDGARDTTIGRAVGPMSGTRQDIRVAHVVRRFVFEEWGGTETVVWNTVLRQRARGVEPEILATSALATPGEETKEGIRIRRFAYKYPYFPMPEKTRLVLDKKGGNPFCKGLLEALREGHFDCIHIHCAGRLAVQCVLLARRLGVPSVISLHGGHAVVPPEELRQMMAPVRGKFHYGGLVDRLCGLRRDALAEASAVICISREEEARLKERYPDRRIVYLPNGVDVASFEKKPSCSPRAEWGIPPERSLMLCISRIDYQKNQLALLEPLARLPQTHLLLVGPVTSSSYYSRIKARAKELGCADRLTVIPGLPPGDPRLKAILHEADMFVLPSLHEPFGIVALEAWAAGLPIIASRAGGLKDFIVDGRNGLLFDPKDADALVRQVEALLGDAALRASLAAAAREDVRAYSWEALVDRLLNLYRELRHEGN